MREIVNQWDRQPYDTDKSWAAFVLYRDLPPEKRSLVRAEELYNVANGKPDRRLKAASGKVRKWCMDKHWVSRVQAFDKHIDSARTKTLEDVVKHRAEKQPLMMHALEVKAFNALQRKDLDAGSIKELRLLYRDMVELQIKLEESSKGKQGTDESIQRWLEATLPSDDAINKIFSY